MDLTDKGYQTVLFIPLKTTVYLTKLSIVEKTKLNETMNVAQR